MSRRAVLAVALAALLPSGASAQIPVSVYYQNVPLWTGESALGPGGVSDFNRLRLTSDPVFGDVSFDVAYEHAATLRERDAGSFFVGGVPGGGEWLELQWTIEEKTHLLWQHRFDRLNVGWTPSGSFELKLGRQVVSWATTLFLTPGDPFTPFNPADPFREFRAGVDAGRLRYYPSALSEIDLIVRPTKNDEVGEELTTLGRGLVAWKGWELSAWGGSLYGDWSGAFGAAGSVGSWAVRGELVVREQEGGTALRTTIGVDRRFALAGKDLYMIAEYQRDGLAAASPDAYLELLQSKPFLRGELQVLGRDELVVQGSYQLHPLWSLAGLMLWNLDDRSVLLSPSVAYSASDSATVSGGLFFGFGDDDVTASLPLPSEYGLAATTAYASVSVFFR